MNRIRPNQRNLNPEVPKKVHKQLVCDFQQFARDGLPDPLEPYLLATYGLDVASNYGGIPIKNPWGKASGQLSMTPQQVRDDAMAGLGFCVLKTVIAQDSSGGQSMRAWAVPHSRMVLERVVGVSGEPGWTVSWLGRGWHRSLDDYLQFVAEAQQIGVRNGMLIVPSCKFHLPTRAGMEWRVDEYRFTVQRLLAAYHSDQSQPHGVMPIEKDFSPTLAGSDLANQRNCVLNWLEQIPSLIREAAGPEPIRVGLKLFNALFDDEFQLAMLRSVTNSGERCPDFVVYANRLFDPEREFEGHRGIARGGPDLSARNLRVLGDFQLWRRAHSVSLGLSGTGDISSGRVAVEYMLRGCSSFQIHTGFQLPASEYLMRRGSKVSRTLHQLYFDPNQGFVAWCFDAAQRLGLGAGATIRVADLVDAGQSLGTESV